MPFNVDSRAKARHARVRVGVECQSGLAGLRKPYTGLVVSGGLTGAEATWLNLLITMDVSLAETALIALLRNGNHTEGARPC